MSNSPSSPPSTPPAAQGFPRPAWVWVSTGVTLIVGGFVLFCLYLFRTNTENEQLIFVYGFAVGLFGGLFCFYRVRQIISMPAQDTLAHDPRLPVLYLRSFREDRRSGFHFWSIFAFSSMATEEEQLAGVMNEIGPFVAIGKPGEKLPQAGAARMYVTHAEWQERVANLMKSAQLVILRAGKTEGFWWEVQRCARSMPPERVVFLLPFTRREYRRFRERAEQYLPCGLPEYRPSFALAGTRVHAVLYFEPDWTPHIVSLKVPFYLTWLGKLVQLVLTWTYMRFQNPLLDVIKKGLQPVVDQLGLAWKIPWYELPKRPKFGCVGGAVALVTAFLMVVAVITMAGRGVHHVGVWLGRVPLDAEDLRDRVKDHRKQFEKTPEMRRALAGLSDQKAVERIPELYDKGVLLLDEPDVLELARLDEKTLHTEYCGTIIRGAAEDRMLDDALALLSVQELETWFALRRKMIQRALDSSPAPPVSAEDLAAAFLALYASLPPDQSKHLQSVLSNLKNDSDWDRCDAFRTVYKQLPAITEPYRGILARTYAF
jgi:hypothetical protein